MRLARRIKNKIEQIKNESGEIIDGAEKMGLKTLIRQSAKAAAAGLLDLSGMGWALTRSARRASGGRRVLIVAFHRVVEDVAAEARLAIPGLLIGARAFEAQLDALHRAGFDVVELERALQILSGETTSSRDVAVVTFDDGYGDVFANALPILRRRGQCATVYLASGCVDSGQPFPHDRLYALLLSHLFEPPRPYRLAREQGVGAGTGVTREDALRCASLVERLIAELSAASLEALMVALSARRTGAGEGRVPVIAGRPLTWDEVRAMADQGFNLGAHTARHAVLTHEPDVVVAREIVESKAAIERQTGRAVIDFAYPNGFFDRRVIAALRRAGFRSAVTTEDAPNRVGVDPLRLRRKTIWENTGRGTFGFSERVAKCQLDDLFGLLSLTHPERGMRVAPPGIEV